MDLFKNGWFAEQGPSWAGMSQNLEVEEVLAHEKSKYQDIYVFKAKKTGLTMTLDDAIQSTEFDEFAYQEMLSHVILYCHPNPKKVLIIGGGDLGVAREVLKHKCVEHVDLCELDERVTELSKKYLPHMAEAASKDPRFHIHFEDGAAYVAKKKNEYDIIITDSSDPCGPAQPLFNQQYYQNLYNALTEGGIIASQGESMWLDADFILQLKKFCKNAGFKHVEYSTIQIPTYPCGSIGAFIASKGNSCKTPLREMTEEEAKSMKYYNKEIHIASFAMPEFFKRKWESI